jgi:uncharacterized protein YdhG (YjbR/CyaY superfamily)
MTRPRKNEEDKKRRKITVRFDDPEYAKICSQAAAIGVTVSKFMREKTMKGYIRVPKYAMVDTALINQLSKLAGLLKQFFTVSEGMHREKTAEILDAIQNLIRRIAGRIEDDREAHTETEEA